MSGLRSGFGVTNEDADWQLLKLSNHKDMFALSVGAFEDDDLQLAFERGIDREWFALVNLFEIPGSEVLGSIAGHGTLMRVFRLTPAGRRYRTELQAKFLEAKAE